MSMGHEVDLTQTTTRQLKIVRIYIYIAWLYFLLFTPIFVFVIKNTLDTVVMLLDLGALICAHWWFRQGRKIEQVTFMLAVIAGMTVGSMVLTGGVQHTGLYILFPYVPFIAFLRSPVSARRWLIGMLFFTVGLWLLWTANLATSPYGRPFLLMAITMYIFTLLLTLAYVHEKSMVDDHLESNTQELVSANRRLLEAAQSQKQATAKAEAMLRSIGEGVIVFDAGGKVEAANQMAEKLLGFHEEQLVDGSYLELVKATDSNGAVIPPDQRPLAQVIATKRLVATELYYQRRGRAAFPAHITIAPVIIEGKLQGAIEVFRDISLEKQVDRSKTEFVSLASHQLRTPLSTISWYAEMLLAGDAGKITKEQARYVHEIYDSNRRMTELVGSLLNVSRIDLGTFSVEPEPTDLVKLAQGIVKDLEPQIFARKLNFQEEYDPNIPILNADPKLMRMVIENLSSNAIKYTPELGTVTLQLKHRAHETQIIVTDSGLGIPAAQQSKIFSKLFRADNVKTHDTEGTGLGLYLVKSIVDYSGGTIWFKSKENKGTTFCVTIPDGGMKHKRGNKELN
ncbi:MAG TPA: PAS domain-containing sensor histidine kinase [Candidatus Saccharimonadales bacterium]|nr:PAS domain-containing sensor histidine kinase [Candidatus Saccharimonadales bacterium]